jgi:hypothetical protein
MELVRNNSILLHKRPVEHWNSTRFGGTYRLHFQGRRINQEASVLIFRPWRWRRHVPPKYRLTINRLHGVISKKTQQFITTAVKNYNPALCFVLWIPCKQKRTRVTTGTENHVWPWSVERNNGIRRRRTDFTVHSAELKPPVRPEENHAVYLGLIRDNIQIQ